MYWFGSGMSVWGYVLMTVSMVAFWALVVGGVVALVRYLSRGSRETVATPVPSTPEQILAERFARGEIDEDEYRNRVTTLRAGSPR